MNRVLLGKGEAPVYRLGIEVNSPIALVILMLGTNDFQSVRVTSVSKIDGVHLDADQHEILGRHLVDPVRKTL
jgi:lysophospholipase L1-like esterase